MFSKTKNPTFEIKVVPFMPSIIIENEDLETKKSHISGSVSILIKKPVNIRTITVSLKKSKLIEWANGSHVTRISFDNELIKHSVSDTVIDVESVLEMGRYEFPFFLWVPDNLEPSMKIEKCFIKYFLEATAKLESNSYLLKIGNYFGNYSDIVPIPVLRVPKILKQYSQKVAQQLPQYYSLYHKDDLKVVLMIQSQYILTTNHYGPIKATLYIDYNPSENMPKKEVSCKEITLKITEECKFFEKVSGISHLDKIVLGKVEYDFEQINNKKPPTVKNQNQSNSNSIETLQNNLSELSVNDDSSILASTLTDTSPSTNPIPYKTPRIDADPRISYELFLPRFDCEPQPNIISDNFSIIQYLDCKAIIQFKEHKEERSLTETSSSEKKVIEEKVLFGGGVIYGIPEWAEEYINSIPTYENIGQGCLFSDQPKVF
ncbi:hypothetical protein BB558_003709 [Smittium angustum]|uniref:Arrestin-like N-terminal domain-containing protein n=1 Tax=Smittium angustum TaxID=133377 RepID=A0A2U1J5D7_SMIAN|nr:hypothetical protein BB558_003709 [Smittium angustum]